METTEIMNWFNTQIKSSLLALLGPYGIATGARQTRTEQIRKAILDELGEFSELNFPKIVIRIQYAPDAEALWFARSEIMLVLRARYGETIAQQKIKPINAQFSGLLPKGLTVRSSSLDR